MFSTLCAIALTPGIGASPLPPLPQARGFALEQAGRELEAELGLQDLPAAERTLGTVLDSEHFFHIDLGGMEVWYPVAALTGKAKEKARAEKNAGDLIEALQTLVATERAWIDVSHVHLEGYETAVGELEVLTAFVGRWKAKALLKQEDGGLFERMARNDDELAEVVQAVAGLKEFMAPGVEKQEVVGKACRLVLLPDRRHYLRLVGLAGLWSEGEQRSRLWDEGVTLSSLAWYDRMQLASMVYGFRPYDPLDPFRASELDVADETAKQQYIAQRGIDSLQSHFIYPQSPFFFEAGVNSLLVVNVVGRNSNPEHNWSANVTNSGSSSAPYSRFVPGGNPAGGTLPPNPAGPGNIQGPAAVLWLQTLGEDHFLGPLRLSQQLGAKAVPKEHPLHEDETAHFLLRTEKADEGHVISAPFWGPAANSKPLPPLEYLDDYEVFFHAFRTAFLRWLTTEGAPSEEEAAVLFARLVQENAVRATTEDRVYLRTDGHVSFAAVVEEVYGVPLDAPGLEDSLVRRFLLYLSKYKIPEKVKRKLSDWG